MQLALRPGVEVLTTLVVNNHIMFRQTNSNLNKKGLKPASPIKAKWVVTMR